MKKVLMMLVVLTMVSSVFASPYLTVKLVTSEDASSVAVTPGQDVSYKLVAILSPIGTTNTVAKNTLGAFVPSITSLNGAAGKDGILSARVNIGQTSSSAIKVSFTSVATIDALYQGTGFSGGTLTARGDGNSDLGALKAVCPTNGQKGVVDGAPVQITLATGTFHVSAVGGPSSTIDLTYLAFNSMVKQTMGGIKVNGLSTGISTESTVDPVFGYVPLTLTPEPVSIVLLALGGLGFLRRRS